MSDFIRLLSYVYEYVDEQKSENVGFVKLDGRNGIVRIYVNLRLDTLKEGFLKVFLCKEKEGKFDKKMLYEGKLANGRFEGISEVSSTDMDGCFAIYIVNEGNSIKKQEYCTFLTDNKEKISVIRDIIESDNCAKEEIVVDEIDKSEDKVEEDIEIASAKEENRPNDMWSELYNQYPKCRIFGEEYQCIMLRENLILAFRNN